MEVRPASPGPLLAPSRSFADRLWSTVAVTVLALLAGAGAAARPDGVLVGIPGATAAVLALASGFLTWRSGVSGLGGLLLPAGGVLAGALGGQAFAPLLLFSGPPLYALVLAALVLAVAAAGASPPRFVLLPVAFAAYSMVAYEAQVKVGPDGDEPQYLMVTESLIRDHDLALDRDFEEARYAPFFSRPLKPDFRIRGLEGEIYSLHAVGLSILILPAYAAFGYAGASFFMALLAALLVRELRRLALELTANPALAEGTAWLVAFSPPLIHFAGLIFTEIPAALLLAVGLRTAVFGRTRRALPVSAVCAAALPWLNVRYSILSLAIAAALGLRAWNEARAEGTMAKFASRLAFPAAILAGSALALGFYHFDLWGFWDPRRVYGRRPEFSLGILPEGLPGLFFDQEYGLFAYAPIFVLSAAGGRALWRGHRPLAVSGLLAAGGVIATASVWPMWRGGFNPPARFLLPLLPILTAGLVLSLRRGIRPAAALLAGWGLWCGLGGALHIDAIHRDRDGTAPFFRTQSGAREWTAALPSFVLSEDRPTRVLAFPWAALLVLPLVSAGFSARRESQAFGGRELILALGVFMIAAALADRMSPRVRSPERSAMRLLGSPALLLPSGQFERAAEAVFPLDLFYEPHRFPGGLGFAEKAPFLAGRYRIVLTIEEGPDPRVPPSLILRDRKSGRVRESVLTPGQRELHSEFDLETRGEYDLCLKGGEPVALAQARIAAVR